MSWGASFCKFMHAFSIAFQVSWSKLSVRENVVRSSPLTIRSISHMLGASGFSTSFRIIRSAMSLVLGIMCAAASTCFSKGKSFRYSKISFALNTVNSPEGELVRQRIPRKRSS